MSPVLEDAFPAWIDTAELEELADAGDAGVLEWFGLVDAFDGLDCFAWLFVVVGVGVVVVEVGLVDDSFENSGSRGTIALTVVGGFTLLFGVKSTERAV